MGLAGVSANGNGVCTFDSERHLYRIDDVATPSVTQVLALAGLQPSYAGVDPAVRDAAALKGTYVHEACDLLDQGTLDWTYLRSECPVLVPYVEAWQRFREKEPVQLEGPRTIDDRATFEDRVWSKALGVAGQLDRIGTWLGQPMVADVKTGKRLGYDVAFQLAGYTALYLLRAGVPHGDALRKACAEVKRVAVQVKDDGTYKVVPYADVEDLDVFVAAVRVAHTRLRNGAKVADAPK